MAQQTDHYVVLGVGRDGDVDEIRHAFRRLATRLHPDQPDHPSEAGYMAVVEAYRVLGDAAAREAFDQSRQEPAADEEILIRPSPQDLPELGELSLMRDFKSARSGEPEETTDRLRRNFSGQHVPKSEALQPLDLEILLRAEEARQGGVLTLKVPTFHTCPVCTGSGSGSLFPCFACHHEGVIEEEEPVRLIVPPNVENGAVFNVPLHGLDIGNMYLRVRMRVEG
jgi:DnaJ-class molecular chaperone